MNERKYTYVSVPESPRLDPLHNHCLYIHFQHVLKMLQSNLLIDAPFLFLK